MRLLKSLLQTLRPMLGLAGGLILVGLSGYVFTLAIAPAYPGSSAADASARQALTTYYFLVTTVLLGVYNGLDQVTNRRIAHTLATGSPLGPALLRAMRDGAGLTAGVWVLLLAASPVLVGRTLHDDLGLFATVLAGTVFAALASVVRGVLAGSRRFVAYGAVWGAEGLARLVLTAAAYLSGARETWVFGLAFVLPYLVSAAVGLFACRDMRATVLEVPDEEEAGSGAASMGLVALATAGVLTTAAANLPQLILSSRVSSTDLAVVAFGHAFLLARIALTVLTPFQSMLLPAFTHDAATGALDALRRRLRSASILCAGVAAAWGVLVLTGGPTVLGVGYLDKAADVPSLAVFAVLGGGTVLFAVATAVQLAIIAVGRYRVVPLVWACGVAVTSVAAFLPGLTPVAAATVAAVAGPLAVLAAMALAMRSTFSAPSLGSGSAEVVYSSERESAPSP